MKRKTLITAALPYANGELHIGHIAGNILPADIYARYKRKKNIQDLGMSFDIFSRTSSPLHKECAKDLFLSLHKSGEMIEKIFMSFTILGIIILNNLTKK